MDEQDRQVSFILDLLEQTALHVSDINKGYCT